MASQEGHPEVAQQLLRYGADVHAVEADGETPLHLAAYYGHLLVTELLLKCGANIDDRNEEGETPFDLASKEDHVEVAQLLAAEPEATGHNIIARAITTGEGAESDLGDYIT
jgi:ankyrin repeat protein